MIIQQLQRQISQVCPIGGVSLGRLDDKATWRIAFAPAATAGQIAAANAALAAFDLLAAQQQEATLALRRSADAQELSDARVNSAITALLDSTPAQLATFASNNFPTLTPAERARMGMVMNMLAVAMRPQIR